MNTERYDKVAEIYGEHYEELCRMAKDSPVAGNAGFEILPALFVICDLAAANSKVKTSRIYTQNAVMTKMDELVPDIDKPLFGQRVRLYSQIMQGAGVRGEWMTGDVSKLGSNPVMRIVIALGDILCNPACADNYRIAPLAELDGLRKMTFADFVMKPMLRNFLEFYKEIYELQ